MKDESNFVKLKRDTLFSLRFKSALGNSNMLSINGSFSIKFAKFGSINQLIFALGYFLLKAGKIGRQNTMSPIEDVLIIRILILFTRG